MNSCYWWNNPEWGVTVDGTDKVQILTCDAVAGGKQRQTPLNPTQSPTAHHSSFKKLWEPNPIFGYYPFSIAMKMLPDVTINWTSLQEEQLAFYPLPLSPQLGGRHPGWERKFSSDHKWQIRKMRAGVSLYYFGFWSKTFDLCFMSLGLMNIQF